MAWDSLDGFFAKTPSKNGEFKPPKGKANSKGRILKLWDLGCNMFITA
jgi:hypothetical protein